MIKAFYIILIISMFTTSSFAFSLKDGYKNALNYDVDTQIIKNNLKTIKYDQDIASSMYSPKIDLSAQAQISKTTKDNALKKKSDQYGAKVVQPIFDGFESKFENKLQDERYNAAKYSLTENENNLAIDYIQSYINTLRQKDLLSLGIENMSISEDIFSKVYKKVQAGYGTKLEFETAKENYTKMKVNLSNLKINYRNAIESLRFYVHKDFDTNELIKPYFYNRLPKNLETALKLAMANNPAYLVAKANIKVAKMEQKRDLKSKYPSLALVGTYDKYNSLDSASDDSYGEYKVGLEFNYNLYDGKKNSVEKKSLLKVNEKEYLKQKSKYQIETNLRSSWNNYILNKDKKRKQESYKNTKKNVLDATIKEFDLGLKDLNTLMDEHSAYIVSKSEYINISYDYILSKYKLLHAMGTLGRFMNNDNLTFESLLSNKLLKKKVIKKEIKSKKYSYKKPSVVEVKNQNINQLTPNEVFRNKFLKAPANKYTINLAYTNSEQKAYDLLEKYNYIHKGFYFSFREVNKLQRIMLGIYDTKQEAKRILKNLPKSLKKAQPRVELILIKQNVYKKYHGNTNQNIFTTKPEKEIILIKPKPNMKQKSDEKLSFKDRFLTANNNKYTINLAYSTSKIRAQKLLDKYDLNNNSFYFTFGKIKKFEKIMMGIYNTKAEAKNVITTLPYALRKAKPRVEPISIKQNLFKKYHKNYKISKIKKSSRYTMRYSNNFKTMFLNSLSNKYTINLALAKTKKNAQDCLNKYDLNNNGFHFSFGKTKKLHRVMMGIYDTKAEAKRALSKLPESLKRAKPRVEPISIKQTLYKKYHNDSLSSNNVGSF